MIKAYFFDWMETLGNVCGENIRDFIAEEEHDSLLIQKFENANIPREIRDLIYSKLSNANHLLYSDSEKIVNTLKPNYKLAIVSNMYGITSEIIRRLFPTFLGQFDVVTLSCEVGMKKPDERIFIHTINLLNKVCGASIKPDEVVMIGDNENKDIFPARNLGMQAKIIDRTKQTLCDII